MLTCELSISLLINKSNTMHSFADRDMFMRYRGGGAGHESIRSAVDRFLPDRDEVDEECRQEYIQKTKKGGRDDKGCSDTDTGESAGDLQDENDREGWDAPGNLMDFDKDEEDFGYQRPTSDFSYLPSSGWGSEGEGANGEEVDEEDEIGTFGLPDF